MNDIFRLFQAFLAPAIFISATSLLILSINVRLMGIVSRLRQFVHAKYDATRNERLQEAEAYTAQIASIERRAGIIQRCFLLALISLAGDDCVVFTAGIGNLCSECRHGGEQRSLWLAMICLLIATLVLHPRSRWSLSVRCTMKRAI